MDFLQLCHSLLLFPGHGHPEEVPFLPVPPLRRREVEAQAVCNTAPTTAPKRVVLTSPSDNSDPQ